MTEPRQDDEGFDPERLRVAADISDRTPVDWSSEESMKRLFGEEAVGFQEVERLAAAQAQLTQEFDTIASPEIGSLIDHYRILSRLGSGSMGVVYRAKDERLQLDRLVALKLVHPAWAGEASAREILLREAQIACSFTHPNVATIFELGSWEERVFIAMEYVEGESLADAIHHHPLSHGRVAEYGAQIASALEAAHEAGIVHRDLKSQNIVITPAGLVKVLDFGIAVRRKPAATAGHDYGPAGWTAGTLPYMAPECLRGEAPDPRCDIWALGVILYEALAGARPFTAATRAELERAIQQDDAALLPRSVPRELRNVVERCLQKSPGRRYQRVGEVRAALETIRDARRPAPRRGLLLAGAVALLGIAGYVAMREGFHHRIPSQPTLIVLPARNAAGDPSQQFLADGLTDDVINTLMKLSAIHVLSHHSSEAIGHESAPLPELARRHSVDYALESSVVPSGDRVRVNVALMDAASDRPVWARAFERPVREALTLDRDIVLGIAGALKLPLTEAERTVLRPAPPVDRAAYEQYVLGRNFVAERNYRRALACYAEAIRIDPGFAAAHAGTARCWIEMLYYRDTPPDVTLGRARDAALRALEIDSTQATAHLALAYVHGLQWDWNNARAELDRAAADEPGSPEVWYDRSIYYGVLGHAREEVEAMQRAVRGDPLVLRYQNELGLAYLNAGRQADAEALFRRVEAEGGSEESQRAEAYRARCLALRGKAAEAVAVLRRLTGPNGAVYAREELPYALARADRRAEAKRLLAKLMSAPGDVSPLATAAAQVALGATDAAFAILERAWEQRDSRILWIRVDQRFDSLRQDPRYPKLVARMGAA